MSSLPRTPATVGEPDTDEIAELERSWGDPRGFIGSLRSIDHKRIAIRTVVTAFAFFGLGGIEAAIMRLQLAFPEGHVVGPDLYDQIFTMHGTTMMFLFAVPVMQGVGLYVVPLMIGTRNIALPRLVAFSYWAYVIGGVFLYASFLMNAGPDAGWFMYVPLAGPEYGIGKRADVWAQMIQFTEIAAIGTAVATMVTILKQRAPGMSLDRMPPFVWAMLVTSVMILFALPAIVVASFYLGMDRGANTQFFNHPNGGDALLWQHIFWFFGHPEVYIIFLPGVGMATTVVSTFARRPLFGYLPVVLSIVATGFVAFGLWVHHMFATGLPHLGQAFFTAASMIIAVPSGIQIFAWIATLWGGTPRLTVSLLFVLGDIFVFVAGGLTGVMLASQPLDLQVHDTFFVVAHLHYVLIGGALFPLFAGIYYWFPKVTGRLLSERAGRWNFWLLFVGFNLTFFPMHVLGFHGMPRRVYSYAAETGWANLNLLASTGAVVIAAAIVVFIANVIHSVRRGAVAGDDPWEGPTLEWSTSSPPPPYDFARPPVVHGLNPRWERPREPSIVVGLRRSKRELLVTNVLDAAPDHRFEQPEPSLWPLITAIAVSVMFIGGVFTSWGSIAGCILGAVTVIIWNWPPGMVPFGREKTS